MSHPEAQTIELGGQARTVLFSAGAFRLAKLKHGTTVTLDDLERLDLETVPRLLWIGLLADDPDLSEEACMVMLARDPAAEAAAMDVLSSALGSLMDTLRRFGGAPKPEPKGEPGKPVEA